MRLKNQEALWVLRAQCHDRDALERLLRSVEPSLRRFVTNLVGASQADDVLQDALLLIYRKLGQLEEPTLFRPWAFRIARRAGLRHLKKEERRLDVTRESVSMASTPDFEPEPTEDSVRDLLHLDGLSPSSRVVLVLHFQEEMSLPEIAAVLELPLGTVKSRLAYGLASLRRHMGTQRSY